MTEERISRHKLSTRPSLEMTIFAHARLGMAAIALTIVSAAGSAGAQTADVQATLPSASSYTEAQLREYIAARDAIGDISRGATFEEQRQAQIQMSRILRAHGFTPQSFLALDRQARSQAALRNRVAALSLGGLVTDQQLAAFAAASLEIDPVTARLAAATTEERSAAREQISAILARHNLSSETYNGIAARAQSDAALADRIAAAQLQIRRQAESGT